MAATQKQVGSIYHVLSPNKHAPPSTKVQAQGEEQSLVTKVEILGVRSPTKTINKTQYFIHYVGTDKRLDKWISEDYIGDLVVVEPPTGAVSSGRGRMSRQNSSGGAGGQGVDEPRAPPPAATEAAPAKQTEKYSK